MDEIRRGAFKRDVAALMGHIRAGFRHDAFGENARQCLDKLWEVAMTEIARLDNYDVEGAESRERASIVEWLRAGSGSSILPTRTGLAASTTGNAP